MSCCVNGCTNTNRTNRSITYHVFPHPLKEKFRHNEWIKAANNSKLLKKDPMAIFRQFRICRKHFDADCFNGGCRRLLHTAVPTLHLTSENSSKLNNRAVNRNNKPGKPITEKYLIDINIDENAKSEDSFVLYKENESEMDIEEETFGVFTEPLDTSFSNKYISKEKENHLVINGNIEQEYYQLIDVIENFVKNGNAENCLKSVCWYNCF